LADAIGRIVASALDDGKTIDLWAKDADGCLAMEATATLA